MSTLTMMRPNLLVRDLAVASAFYCELLGFSEVTSEKGFALLRTERGAELGLVHQVQPTPSSAYLYVTGLDELLAKIEAAGWPIITPLTTRPWGLRDFVVRDPDGHDIAIGEWVR